MAAKKTVVDHSAVDPVVLLRSAVSAVLKDEGFQLPTTPARNAIITAENMLQWLDTNKEREALIASSLVTDIDECFPKSKSARVACDKFWTNIFQLRSTEKFRELWSTILLETTGRPACPIFYQFVVDHIIKQLVMIRFPTSAPSVKESSTCSGLDNADLSVLRYTAGSVLRSLKKKVQKSADVHKEELLFCLAEMIEQSGPETRAHFSEQWADLVDRGGLVHISDTIFTFFAALEAIVQSHYQADNPHLSNGLKESIITAVQEDEEVLFYWSLVSSNWVGEIAQHLFILILQHWITLRGFSFASSFVEEYKRTQKKTLEKSKGIRKKLLSKGTTIPKAKKEEEVESSEDEHHPEN